MIATEQRTKVAKDYPIYRNTGYVPNLYDDDDETFNSSGFSSNYNSLTTTDTEPAFEIEKEYNSIEKETSESEYRVVSNPMHEVERNRVKVATNSKLTPRLKIMITVFSLVFALLVGFSIYNAVAIAGNSTALAQKQSEVIAAQKVINGLEEQYNELGTDEAIKNGVLDKFVEANDSNTIIITRPELDVVKTYKAPSNWFDKICEFFSSLF